MNTETALSLPSGDTFSKSTCFQLWTATGEHARTYTTATAAARALVHSPSDWYLEEFWGCVSKGIIRMSDESAMKRLWKIVAEEAYP